MALKTTPIALNGITEKIIPILREHGVVHASIFGSYVRGDYTENSDIDVLVEFQTGMKQSLLDVVNLKQRMEDCTGKVIDIVTQNGLNQRISKYVYENIIQII